MYRCMMGLLSLVIKLKAKLFKTAVKPCIDVSSQESCVDLEIVEASTFVLVDSDRHRLCGRIDYSGRLARHRHVCIAFDDRCDFPWSDMLELTIIVESKRARTCACDEARSHAIKHRCQ